MRSEIKELREEVKNIIMQHGMSHVYNKHIIHLYDRYCGTDIQNAFNYFQYSPTQAKFRDLYP